MHTPTVVVFDLKWPWLRLAPGWKSDPRWGFRRRRYYPSCQPNHYATKPMAHWWRPAAWTVHVRGRRWAWSTLVTVWHREPEARDNREVCKGMGSSDLTAHNLAWAFKHRAHLHYQVPQYRRVRNWLRDRCGECGRRFLWRDRRIGYMSSDAVYHDPCMTLRQVRSQLDDLTQYMQGTADTTTRWRVTYGLDNLPEAEQEEAASGNR